MKIGDRHFRTIWLNADGFSVDIIDQTRLPHALSTATLSSAEEVAHAIATMMVRGAPLIGASAAYGMALAMRQDASNASLERAAALLVATRPSAVNLAWGVRRMHRVLCEVAPAKRSDLAYREAALICEESVRESLALGRFGAEILTRLAATKRPGEPLNVLTHCNAGWFAAIDWGTALAPVYAAHDQGVALHVFVGETRPRNQGAALTAFELGGHGVPHTLIVDNAGGQLMQAGAIDVCFVGADRVTANGDVCNKIGTYLKALAARDNAIPFYVVFPSSTIDWGLASGADIPIEERSEKEVTHISGLSNAGSVVEIALAPPGTHARNPAFDVTPARLVTGLITERGVAEASGPGLRQLFP